MVGNIKQVLLVFVGLSIIGCGETPTSQLSEQFPILRSGPFDMEFAFIPSGAFRMGSPDDEESREYDETLHWVKLTEDYWMQTTEVTRGQWYKVMGSYPDSGGQCYRRDEVIKRDNHPAVCVSWDEVKLFVHRLNNKERGSGYKYSLPTEAQWEYAARAYTETPYSIEGPLESFAWYDSTSDGHSHPVGELKANLFGLHDVHGNVWEFVSDWYEEAYPKADSFSDARKNPRGPDDGSGRVRRGGAWFHSAQVCRSASRNGFSASFRHGFNGFRLMRTKI